MTKTIPADLRKTAKTMARERGIPHQKALDTLAREAGHSGWGALLASRRTPPDPFRSLILELWEAGGTDLHVEPWTGLDIDREEALHADANGPMTSQERRILLSHLSTMMTAKIPVDTALGILSRNDDRRIARTARNLAETVSSRTDLLLAMSRDTDGFPGETGTILASGSTGPFEAIHALRRAMAHEEEIRARSIEECARADGPIRRGASILFRIHGRRRLHTTLDPDGYDALRAAIIPCMQDWNDRQPNDGTIRMDLDGRAHVLPIASFPTNGDDKFVVRVPDRWVSGLALEDLGIRDLESWMRICRSGPGIVIVSGKTSSGRSTTIARTIERLRSEGIDAVGEEDNAPFHENRVAEMLEAARSKTILLEGYGSSLDRAITNAMTMGAGTSGLARHFRGGIHQSLHMSTTGPRTMDSSVMPWV